MVETMTMLSGPEHAELDALEASLFGIDVLETILRLRAIGAR